MYGIQNKKTSFNVLNTAAFFMKYINCKLCSVYWVES